VNTVLDGSYRIMRVVGSGGFGITYEAEDVNLGTLVAIKEYYPFDFGDRDRTMSVRPKSDRHRQTFDWGRSNFLQEARTLARFEHPSIVRVTRVFEANSTAYMVMRFEQGASFESWLSHLGRPPTQEELDSIIAPLLDALQMMHAANFLHRDIAPDNVIIRTDGTPVLLDFGAARRAVAEMSHSLTGIVKAGYSPHEQYATDGRRQGPWSDLYALGGMLYRAVVGRPPEEATLRFDEDHMATAVSSAKGNYRRQFLQAIDTCLKVRHSERPQSVAQLRPMLLGSKSQPRGTERLSPTFKIPSAPAPAGRPSALRRVAGQWPAIAATVAVLGGAYGGYEYRRIYLAEQEAVGGATRDRAEHARRVAAAAEAEMKRQADAEKRRQEQETADARQRQVEIEEARRRRERADAAEADARRRAEEAAEAKRKEEQRIAALEDARRKEDDLRRRKAEEADNRRKEEQRIAALEDARRKADEARARAEALERENQRRQDDARRRSEVDAAERRKEEQRIAALEESRRSEARRREDEERARLAIVPDDVQRAEFVRKIQAVLKASRCYDGDITGRSNDAQPGLNKFVDNASKRKVKLARIELTKASVGDFETWLRDANPIKEGLCTPTPPPQASKPERRKVEAPEQPRSRPQQPQRRAPAPAGRGGGPGLIQGI
jgi:hypothetical protein